LQDPKSNGERDEAEPESEPWVRTFESVGAGDVAEVGGKNASLGEMIGALSQRGIRVPRGFATTAAAYRDFVAQNGLEADIEAAMKAWRSGKSPLHRSGEAIRQAFEKAEIPEAIAAAIRRAYRDLATRCGREALDVAVRSSATAEDLPEASFAGQQETFLNIRGEECLLDACRRCYASLFTDRAISYREEKGFGQDAVALSIGVQEMVRSDQAGAGVLFTLDPETGFEDVVVIDASLGLGEAVVQGIVDPDQYIVYAPLLGEEGARPIIQKRRGAKSQKIVYAEEPAGPGGDTIETIETPDAERLALVLSDDEILLLARWAKIIEKHYGQPMDVEWAKDGRSGELHVVQARPETVQSRKKVGAFQHYTIGKRGRELLSGLAIGEAVAAGEVCLIRDPGEIESFVDDAILVTPMTDPDWGPIMKRASAIVTDHGGRTSHAAIVSRELGLPAIVGTGNATEILESEQEVTVCCAEGDEGKVYEGVAEYEVETISLESIPSTRTKVMINLASPGAAFRWASLGADGVGLARMEFIINDIIKIHPMALVRYDSLEDAEAKERIAELTRGWEDNEAYFVDQLAYGICRLAACVHPRPAIVRMSDFKTNEYAKLVGGREFEHEEANPMLGFRGASRYYSDRYREGFGLECRAIRKAREEIGFTNIVVMIPFCRTPEEADRVLEVLAENGLIRGRRGLAVYAMCEIPSNVLLAEEFAERFDGFSIGSNDLTQLILGVDRDSEELAHLFDASHPAVRKAIRDFIVRVHARNSVVGFCGQAPSDDPRFVRELVDAGIDSVSVSPDGYLAARREVAAAEALLDARRLDGKR
jgi:pyruvate,water dikinase